MKSKNTLKRFRNSKTATQQQLEVISHNLSRRFNKACYVQIQAITYLYNLEFDYSEKYQLSFVPGFDLEECTQINFKSWGELVEYYYTLMKKE